MVERKGAVMKLRSIVLAVVAVFLFCSIVYGAEGEETLGGLFEYSGQIAVAGNVSGAIPKEDGDPTIFLGGYLSYDVLNCLGLGIESGWARWTEEAGGVDYGKLTMVPLIGDIFLKAPIKEGQYKIVPYGVVGIGIIFWDFEESTIVKNAG